MSGPSTLAFIQIFLLQRVLTNYQLQIRERKTNSEKLSDLLKVTGLKNDKLLVH